jgi:hypothetical protein
MADHLEKVDRNPNTNDTPSCVDSTLTQIQEVEKPVQDDVEAGMTSKCSSPTVPNNQVDDEDWEIDPENPRNWPFRKKWTTVAIVSFDSVNG